MDTGQKQGTLILDTCKLVGFTDYRCQETLAKSTMARP